MQFLIIAYDYTDEDALGRRMKVREAHIAHIAVAKAKGHALMGAAILDDATGKMTGSSLIVEFPTREDLEHWLDTDPYLIEKVWEHVYVQPCQVAPSFVG